MKFNLYMLAFSLLYLAACGNDTLIKKNYDIQPNAWAYRDSLNFDFEVKDTNKIYNITLTVAHQNAYRFQNLYTKIVTIFPNNLRTEQPLSLELYDASGKPQGKCSGGDCKTEIMMQENAYFNQAGKYRITIYQHSRDENLQGIESLALRIEDNKKQRK